MDVSSLVVNDIFLLPNFYIWDRWILVGARFLQHGGRRSTAAGSSAGLYQVPLLSDDPGTLANNHGTVYNKGLIFCNPTNKQTN
jgi:hypothetical protein